MLPRLPPNLEIAIRGAAGNTSGRHFMCYACIRGVVMSARSA
jgi:hypothetical protein